MTKPIDLTAVVADLLRRVEALEMKDAVKDPNEFARLTREERRAKLGLSPLHSGKPDARDIVKEPPLTEGEVIPNDRENL